MNKSPLLPRYVLLATLAAGLPAQASGADDTFRIGVVARDGGGARVEGLSRIESEFGRALRRPVQVFVAENFSRLIDAHLSGRIDYAVYSTPAFAAAQLRCDCLLPVAAPVAGDGSVGMRSVLIGDAAPRLAVGAGDSLATRLVPILASPDAAAARSSGSLVGTASTSEAQALYERRDVQGYFGWEPASPEEMAGDIPASSGDGVRWKSEVIPYGPHAVRADLDEKAVKAIASLLLRGREGDETAASLLDPRSSGRFAAVSGGDYALALGAVALLRDGDSIGN